MFFLNINKKCHIYKARQFVLGVFCLNGVRIAGSIKYLRNLVVINRLNKKKVEYLGKKSF